jgi:hypothetical protein
MPAIVLKDVKIEIGAVPVTLSDRANSITLTYEVEAVETTAFGATGRSYTGGLQNNTIEIEFMQDFAAANVEATIYPLVGTSTTVKLTPTSSATSATNPSYTLTGCFLSSHTPINGATGELAMTSLSFTGGALTKATS